MMRHGCIILVIGFVLVLGLASATDAQEVAGAQADPFGEIVIEPRYGDDVASVEPAYGTASNITYTVPIMDFMVPNSNVTWATAETGSISVYQTSTASVNWWAPVHLPSGALVSSIELEACDSTSTGAIVFGMARGISPGGAASNITPIGSTGTATIPGCSLFPLNLTTPVTINNYNNLYWLFVAWQGAFNSSNRVYAVRVYYNLQISPAPATATFTDVPTSSSFFAYVEALYRSGITAGCGGGKYCPDAPVTRGQMAVFLSRALGLHWPN